MKQRLITLALGSLIASTTFAGAEPDTDKSIRFERTQDTLFLSCADVAAALGFEVKTVDSRRLITFCRNGDAGFCIPLRLEAGNHQNAGQNLLLASDVVTAALRVRVVEAEGRVTLKRLAPEATPEISPTGGYNAEWGPGRGFSRGDTLPDIPLMDMEGNEVRFSHFLGKRYILYCWASW